MKHNLLIINEPRLVFGHGQQTEYPRDGLFLFGPPEELTNPAVLRYGVIGTSEGIRRFHVWAESVQRFIAGYRPRYNPDPAHHMAFPGFSAAFGAQWITKGIAEIAVSKATIVERIRRSNRHEAIKSTVEVFSEEIIEFSRREEAPPDFWFVVIPDDVYRFGRPNIRVPREEQTPSLTQMTRREAQVLKRQPSLFAEINEQAKTFEYTVNFRRQLKARLLEHRIVVQIVRESTLTPEEFSTDGRPHRRVEDPATVAWKLCTAAFYKAGGIPWKLASIRSGVCYVGLVFKRVAGGAHGASACCGAQMFLTSGEGVVFRGAIGPWYSEKSGEFHLSEGKARELIEMVVAEYQRQHDGEAPRELFIHGRTWFNRSEWTGFASAVPDETKVVGIRIDPGTRDIKLFRRANYPVVRGTALVVSDRSAYLWSSGYVSRLDTYLGPETPNPIKIDLVRGESDIQQVLEDILALTKINFNSCIFNDRKPVTIRFADAVGDILLAAPIPDLPPLPFKFYI